MTKRTLVTLVVLLSASAFVVGCGAAPQKPAASAQSTTQAKEQAQPQAHGSVAASVPDSDGDE